MFVRTIPTQGVPARGSIQDRVAREMIAREHRKVVRGQVYLGRLLTAGSAIPPKLFDLWTTLYTMEVTHETYTRAASRDKEKLLKDISARDHNEVESRTSMFSKLDALTATDDQMRPASAEDMEEVKRRFRRRHLQVRTPDGKRVPLAVAEIPTTKSRKGRK